MMIQQWWSRSSDGPDLVMMSHDDLDPVMMIEEWLSRSSDDPNLVMMFHDDPDREMIQIWWWRWLEYKDELKTKMTWRRADPVDTEKKTSADKLCRVNTFLVKRECWCICNFRMYSSMYLMYCNPIFILGCIYYVFESCYHALMFRSGGSIM